MFLHLTSETYHVFQFRGQLENLTFLSKFWILFAALLSFDFTMEMVFGHMPFPMIMNIVRMVYIPWLMYKPMNVINTYNYIESYIKIVSEAYNVMLLYAFALLHYFIY